MIKTFPFGAELKKFFIFLSFVLAPLSQHCKFSGFIAKAQGRMTLGLRP